jgi:DHA1 family multidrug resistance protein-like MFS transporter
MVLAPTLLYGKYCFTQSSRCTPYSSRAPLSPIDMTELIRDTAFGHLVRFLSRGKYLKYAEEADPSTWTRYIDEKKSGYLAHHGDTNPPEDGTDMEGIGGVRTREDEFTLQPPPGRHDPIRTPSESSSKTRVGDEHANINNASGIRVDSEKGRDIHLVSWYGPNDPGMAALTTTL